MTAYAPHAAFVAPARHKAELWRFMVGLVLTVFAYIMLVQVFVRLVQIVLGPGFLTAGATGEVLDMYLMLSTFACMSLAVGITARLLHQRSFASLLGPIGPLIRDFRAVCVMMVILMGVIFVLPPWDMGAPYLPNMALGTWLTLLLPSLLFVFVQVSAEEIVFRGYVQQQLAARFRSPLVWMVLPSTLFALGHYLPDTAGENALVIALWSGVFGMLMADLTARSGSLGPAIAVHFANNVSAIMIISLPDGLSGLALYVAPFSMQDAAAMQAWLPVDFLMMIVLWLAARLAIRR
ncbi:MAG: lysostaphin resistance A-like protein [Sulfitobacter sp.]